MHAAAARAAPRAAATVSRSATGAAAAPSSALCRGARGVRHAAMSVVASCPQTQGAVASCARRASKFVPAAFFASLVPRTRGASFVSAFALAARPPRPIEHAQSHTQSLVALLAGFPPTRARPELRSISCSFRPSARLSNFAARARESCLRKKGNCAGPPPRVRMNPKPEKVETWEERKRGWEKTTHEGERSEPTRRCKP